MIPDSVREIMTQLNNAGYQVYIVGGSVRDVVLGKEPSDFDLATDARPEQIHALFGEDARSTENSCAHGTVFVRGIDVTTFRIDHDEDGRSARVEFADSILDDTSRRDFTFNGMAMLPNGEIYDPFDGQGDLERKVVRAIGDPEQRVKESYVRMLRACRFMALDLLVRMDINLHIAIRQNRFLIHQVPVELIQRELMKMMAYPAPMNGIDAMRTTGLLHEILPELAQTIGMEQKGCFKHEFNVFHHSLLAMSAVPANPLLRLAALLHDIGKPHCHAVDENGKLHFYSHEEVGAKIAGDIMHRLRFSNSEMDYVVTLVREHMTLSTYYAPTTMRGVRRLLGRLNSVPIEDLLLLKSADRFARDGLEKDDSDEQALIRQMVSKIRDKHHALRVTDLVINGDDLIAMGYVPGPDFGQALNQLLEEVLDDERLNTREYLLNRVETMMKGG